MLDIDYQGHVMAKDKILYYCLKIIINYNKSIFFFVAKNLIEQYQFFYLFSLLLFVFMLV